MAARSIWWCIRRILTSPDQRAGRTALRRVKAGDDAGGDKRGRQSAFLTVVSKGASAYGQPMVNIAVDDGRKPMKELRRLLDVQTSWNLSMQIGTMVSAGKYGEARALARRAEALAPGDIAPVFILGVVTYLDGDPREALTVMRRARQMGDAHFTAWWEVFRPFPPVKNLFEDKAFSAEVFRDERKR